LKAGLVYQGTRSSLCLRRQTSPEPRGQPGIGTPDPSIIVMFRNADADEDFLCTTTPWTLISNTALAVWPEHNYARASHNGLGR
jgi:isoleucyl-tRNA synthetase